MSRPCAESPDGPGLPMRPSFVLRLLAARAMLDEARLAFVVASMAFAPLALAQQ